MNNEIIYFATTLLNLFLALAAFRMGKHWLLAFIITNLVLVSCFAGKVVDIFGFATTVAGPFYAAIFLATDALTEFFGKKEGHKSVLIGFATTVVFVLLAQMSLLIEPVSFSQGLHEGMGTVFDTSVRIFIASMAAYLIAQNLDIWLYHFVSTKTGGKFLWLRNNVSTIISQFVDSIVFFGIAFYGVMPNWIEIALVGYVAKLAIALLDTPFIYLAKVVKK